MKKRKKIISLVVAVTAVFCFATTNVSAITFLKLNVQNIGETQTNEANFAFMVQPHIVPVDKPSNREPKKAKPNHSDKKGEVPSPSAQNSAVTSSSSSVSAPSSSAPSSSFASSSVPVISSPQSNSSLLIITGICLAIALGLTVLAFVMHKKKAGWLDETCEIRINEEAQQLQDENKK